MTDEQLVEAVARRVVELLRDEQRGARGLVDAATVARTLGVSRDTVYEHAGALGATRLGEGPRPRLRFDLDRVREGWAARSASEESAPTEKPLRKRAPRPSRGGRSGAIIGHRVGHWPRSAPDSRPSGAPMTSPIGTARECLLMQLALIAGREQHGFVEIRYRRPGGMASRWHPVHHRLGPTIATALDLGRDGDVFVGGALRDRRDGGKAAVSRARALWVDCDTHESADRLRNFDPAPTMLLRSGSEHGLHGWWALRDPIDAPDQLERALRRLAHHLGADMACTDAGRIMRAAGTSNHKHEPPRPVEVERAEIVDFAAHELVADLPDPPGLTVRPPHPAVGHAHELDDALRAIPAALYVEALTGHPVGRDGKARCPFHEDRTPSLHCYPEPERGWCCHAGCGAGSIIDFGARLYGIEPRGAGYFAIRERLEHDLRKAAR